MSRGKVGQWRKSRGGMRREMVLEVRGSNGMGVEEQGSEWWEIDNGKRRGKQGEKRGSGK